MLAAAQLQPVGPREGLKTVQKAVILGVASDPEPCDLVVVQQSDGAVSDGHAHRLDGLSIVDLLELKAGVPGVFAEESIGFLGGTWISGGTPR